LPNYNDENNNSGIFSELDKGVTIDSVNIFESSLNEIGIQNDIVIYPEVDHVFVNPSGDRYAPDELKDAWKRLSNFRICFKVSVLDKNFTNFLNITILKIGNEP